MKVVEPIKNKKDIELIKNILQSKGKVRDLLLFELGINSALRISDLLNVTVGDIFDENLTIKSQFRTREKKTGKHSVIHITSKVAKTLELYKNKYPGIVSNPNNYLFFQQKRLNKQSKELGFSSITPCMARKLISGRCKGINLNGNYGTHSLRKTRGFQARMAGVSIELIQYRLNHSSLAVTKRYLGISDAELEKVCNDLDL